MIPRFVVRHLKAEPSGSLLRQAVEPSKRVQDIEKNRLLCAACEGRFARWEGRFANEVYWPFQHEGRRSFRYEVWLRSFAISLAWRQAIDVLGEFADQAQVVRVVSEALNCWKVFLLGNSAGPGPYAHHMLFSDSIPTPDTVSSYLLRGLDGGIMVYRGGIYVYANLAGLIFWTGVDPAGPPGWKNTLITPGGAIQAPQSAQSDLGEILAGRAAAALKHHSSVLSEKQRQRIEEHGRHRAPGDPSETA